MHALSHSDQLNLTCLTDRWSRRGQTSGQPQVAQKSTSTKMPSKRQIPSFQSATKKIKARTPRQQQYFDRQQRDCAEVKSRAEAFLTTQATLSTSEAQPSTNLHGQGGALDSSSSAGEHTPPLDFFDDIEPDNLDHERELAPAAEELDPMLALLDNSYHQSRRLAQEKRWCEAYENMLPTFILQKHHTNAWGNPIKTHHNFKSACECPTSNRRTRWVDLVDTECEYLIKSNVQ